MSEPPAGPDAGGLPPDVLDRLRRSVPLHLDAMGGFSLGGQAVSHPRVDAALRRGLDLTDDGEITVRIGPHWCYLTVTDCPLRVLGVSGTPPGVPLLHLDDGRRIPLPAGSLWDEPTRGLRCHAPSALSGRPLPARFTNRAQMELLPWLEIDDEGRGVLTVAERSYAVGAEPPSPT